MCGISGIINKCNEKVQGTEIEAINKLIAHRGPDGDGFYFGENFAFGHRRLAILDLSEDGQQPMKFDDKYVVIFNGEIYNYIEIKEELINKGYQFKSSSDTEVILASYDCWGEACVHKFNGMWSFSIYDRKKNILFCSRDRFGIKPFYYAVVNNKFIFGSEIKQLLYFFDEIKANKNILLEYLITGVEEHSNSTFFENVFKLEQGSNLIYDLKSHVFEVKKYYQIKINDELNHLSLNEAVQCYKEKLEQSVSLRMRSDVEVGTCLSGGLDSSSVTAISAKVLKENSENKIKAIHAKASDKSIDESEYAKLVAQHVGADFFEITPSFEDFKNNIDFIIELQEEPFGSPSIVMQYFVLKKARELNCIVMLDGQGGDETLLGYERYYPAYLKSIKGLKKINAFLNSSKNSKLSKKQVIQYYFYFTKYKLRLKRLKQKHNYLKAHVLDSYQTDILRESANNYLNLIELQKLEISKTQLPHLLKYEDKNSMINSVETRLPFIDYQCVEAALSMPNQFKIREGWTKYILRKSMIGLLPDKIIWRKSKLGFNAPEEDWLKKIIPEINQTISNSNILNAIMNMDRFNIEKQDLKTIWRLFNIAKWEEVFNVKL